MSYRDDEFSRTQNRIRELKEENESLKKEILMCAKHLRREKVMLTLKNFFASPLGIVLLVVTLSAGYFFMAGLSYSYITEDCSKEIHSTDYGKENACHAGHGIGAIAWPLGLPATYGYRMLKKK